MRQDFDFDEETPRFLQVEPESGNGNLEKRKMRECEGIKLESPVQLRMDAGERSKTEIEPLPMNRTFR